MTYRFTAFEKIMSTILQIPEFEYMKVPGQNRRKQLSHKKQMKDR